MNLTHILHSHLPQDETPTASSDSSLSLTLTSHIDNDYQALCGSYGRGRGHCGSGRGGKFSNATLQCQVCSKYSHSALQC